MAIKLKRLINNNCIAKYISLLVMFMSLSIGFEACFNLKYNFDNPFSYDMVHRFYTFGVAYEHLTSDMLDDYIYLALGCITIAILFFTLYKFNNRCSSKFEKAIISFFSNFSIEIMLVFISVLAAIRFYIWSSCMPFYDRELINCNFFILLFSYLCYQSIKLNSYNKVRSSFFYNLFKELVAKYKKKPILKKLSFFLVFCTLLNLVFIFIFFKPIMKYMYMGSVNAIEFAVFTIVLYSCIYHIAYRKFKYIKYLNDGIKNIENGDLNYKLDVIGNDEIAALATSINNITNGLETALENQVKSEKMKSELLTNVSHDLKTPLTSIVNYVDILKNNDLDKDTMKDYINILDKKSKRLKTLIEDIFEASKINSGDIELDFEKTDIKELLIQSIVELEDKIDESSLDFIIETPDDSVFTFIDGKKTWRVFENLIGNILKYSLSNTRVYIDMIDYDDKVIIVFKNISNHKLNIKPKDLIERFRRGDVSRNTDGSGLGLSIVQSIVDLQHGEMKIDIDGDLFKATLTFDKYLECVL